MAVEYEIPTSARSLTHYKNVFPGVFDNKTNAPTLVIGPGLSNISLQRGVVAIDPGFKDISGMEKRFYADGRNIYHELDATTELIEYSGDIKTNKTQNSHLVAALASQDFSLPFPRNFFENIVSSNCIFGGLEIIQDPENVIRTLQNCLNHLAPGGKLSLFPYLYIPAKDIWLDKDIECEDAVIYRMQFYRQRQILYNLQSNNNLMISQESTSIREDRNPQILQTVTLHCES